MFVCAISTMTPSLSMFLKCSVAATCRLMHYSSAMRKAPSVSFWLLLCCFSFLNFLYFHVDDMKNNIRVHIWKLLKFKQMLNDSKHFYSVRGMLLFRSIPLDKIYSTYDIYNKYFQFNWLIMEISRNHRVMLWFVCKIFIFEKCRYRYFIKICCHIYYIRLQKRFIQILFIIIKRYCFFELLKKHVSRALRAIFISFKPLSYSM